MLGTFNIENIQVNVTHKNVTQKKKNVTQELTNRMTQQVLERGKN